MVPHLKIEGTEFAQDESYDHYAKRLVPKGLVLEIAWQEEAQITRVFAHIYEVPLKLISDSTKAILWKIATNKITAELKRRIDEIESAPSTGEMQGSGSQTNDAIANNLLLVYTAGHNIIIPGLPGLPPSMDAYQPVVLEGETLKTKNLDTISQREMRFGSFKNQSKKSTSFFDGADIYG